MAKNVPPSAINKPAQPDKQLDELAEKVEKVRAAKEEVRIKEEAKLRQDQLVVPSSPLLTDKDGNPIKIFNPNPMTEAANKYLEDNHWLKVAEDEMGNAVWKDPQESHSKGVEHEFVLPGKTPDRNQTVRQLHVPSAPWNYSTAGAVLTQRRRDLMKDNAESPLEKLHSLEKFHDSFEEVVSAAVIDLEKIANKPAPERRLPEFITMLQLGMQEAIGRLKESIRVVKEEHHPIDTEHEFEGLRQKAV